MNKFDLLMKYFCQTFIAFSTLFSLMLYNEIELPWVYPTYDFIKFSL